MGHKLEPGDVFDSEIGGMCRVLVADDIFFLFEAKDFTGWNKSNIIHQHLTFYGEGVKPFFAKHPTFLRNEPFTAEETNIIRPDLPYCFGRTNQYEWKDLLSLTQNDFEVLFGTAANKLIIANKIYIAPQGPKGGMLKLVAITPDNGHSFSLKEIFVKTASVQMGANTNIQGGIGLYRLGVKSKCPTFYISDYYNGESQIYKLEEEGFDWEAHFELHKENKPAFRTKKIDEIGIYEITFNPRLVAIHQDIFTIRDLWERTLLKSVITAESFMFDLSALPPGQYIYGITDEQNRFKYHGSTVHRYDLIKKGKKRSG